jgi:hypothetical protein
MAGKKVEPVLKVYEGDALPAEQEVALKNPLMKCTWTNVCQVAGIVSIDGKKLGTGWRVISKSSEFRLLPGKHTVEFWMQNGSAVGSATLWFVGEAGKAYVVEYKPKGYAYSLLIRDETGSPVGGVKGSNDEPLDPIPGQRPTPAEGT